MANGDPAVQFPRFGFNWGRHFGSFEPSRAPADSSREVLRVCFSRLQASTNRVCIPRVGKNGLSFLAPHIGGFTIAFSCQKKVPSKKVLDQTQIWFLVLEENKTHSPTQLFLLVDNAYASRWTGVMLAGVSSELCHIFGQTKYDSESEHMFSPYPLPSYTNGNMKASCLGREDMTLNGIIGDRYASAKGAGSPKCGCLWFPIASNPNTVPWENAIGRVFC